MGALSNWANNHAKKLAIATGLENIAENGIFIPCTCSST
jgi:hypothetical protein